MTVEIMRQTYTDITTDENSFIKNAVNNDKTERNSNSKQYPRLEVIVSSQLLQETSSNGSDGSDGSDDSNSSISNNNSNKLLDINIKNYNINTTHIIRSVSDTTNNFINDDDDDDHHHFDDSDDDDDYRNKQINSDISITLSDRSVCIEVKDNSNNNKNNINNNNNNNNTLNYTVDDQVDFILHHYSSRKNNKNKQNDKYRNVDDKRKSVNKKKPKSRRRSASFGANTNKLISCDSSGGGSDGEERGIKRKRTKTFRDMIKRNSYGAKTPSDESLSYSKSNLLGISMWPVSFSCESLNTSSSGGEKNNNSPKDKKKKNIFRR
eukprot:Pgem_evm1s17327